MRWDRDVTCIRHRTGAYRLSVGSRRKRVHLEDLGVDGRKIIKRIFREWDWGMHWINLAQDRVKWPSLLNAVMNYSKY